MSELSFTTADAPTSVYHLLNAIVAPRPIAWISSRAADGTLNLAPHSFTTVLSGNPPMLGFVSVGRKDTLRNIEHSLEFVYNVAGEKLGEQINRTSADFPPDVSEFEWAGVTPAPCSVIATPRVAEAEIAVEMELRDIYKVPGADSWIVVGEAVAFHIAERIMRNGRVDPSLLRPLGRMAGSEYATFGGVLKMPRPTYAGLRDEGARPLPPIRTNS